MKSIPMHSEPVRYLYIPLLRPASSFTLPKGLAWDYVEAPTARCWCAARPGIPLSTHPYGVIATRRPLTAEECEHFDLEVVPEVKS
jgi:hypothetical protein